MSQSFKYLLELLPLVYLSSPLDCPRPECERKKGVVKKQLRYAKSDMVYQLFISKGG